MSEHRREAALERRIAALERQNAAMAERIEELESMSIIAQSEYISVRFGRIF